MAHFSASASAPKLCSSNALRDRVAPSRGPFAVPVEALAARRSAPLHSVHPIGRSLSYPLFLFSSPRASLCPPLLCVRELICLTACAVFYPYVYYHISVSLCVHVTQCIRMYCRAPSLNLCFRFRSQFVCVAIIEQVSSAHYSVRKLLLIYSLPVNQKFKFNSFGK